MKNLDQIKPGFNDDTYYKDLWKIVSRDLISHYGEDLYKSWFSKISFLEIQGKGNVLLAAPSNFIRDWIKSNYFDTITQLWQHHDTTLQSLDIITKELLKETTTAGNESGNLAVVKNADFVLDANEGNLSSLDPRFTFDNFVVGPPNELAYAASLAVAEADNAVTKSNPLFL
jgi:chromosomal replication initiator protein